jgi:hypothetical protein
MRLRLVHTLSLILLAFSGVAVIAMGGLTAWQLRHGFSDHLVGRDVQHFQRFVDILEARLTRDKSVSELLAGRMDLRGVLDELNSPPSGPPWFAGMLANSAPGDRDSEAFPE